MKSVLSQTSKDFEYVVVDGGSTDGSVEVIRRFASAFGERIRWISEPDKGIYNAIRTYTIYDHILKVLACLR